MLDMPGMSPAIQIAWTGVPPDLIREEEGTDMRAQIGALRMAPALEKLYS
jgi:cytochrome c-type biogenesis protein CcmE